MNMQHTVTIIPVQRLVGGMISTLQTGLEVVTILTFTVTVIRTQVPIVTVPCGQETIISAPMT